MQAKEILIEEGELDNGETYMILRSNRPISEKPYTLYFGTNVRVEGSRLYFDNENVVLFHTMIHAQQFVAGYARGRDTHIKTKTRVNT